jgi:hypothetical protein
MAKKHGLQGSFDPDTLLWLGPEERVAPLPTKRENNGCFILIGVGLTLLSLLVAVGAVYAFWLGVNSMPWGILVAAIAIVVAAIGLYFFASLLRMTIRTVRYGPAALDLDAKPEQGWNLLDRVEFSRLLAQLDGEGFFKYADPWIRGDLIATILLDGELFDPLTKRVYMVDGEELAYKGVRDFVSSISYFLKQLRVNIASFSEDYDEESGYKVTVNGKTYEILSPEEMSNEGQRKLSDKGGHGKVAITRTIAMLNQLLTIAKSVDRAYTLSSAEQDYILFVTPKMLQLIKDGLAGPDAEKLMAIGAGEPSDR